MSARTKKIVGGTAVAGIGVMIGRRLKTKTHTACTAKCGEGCKHAAPGETEGEVGHAA